MHDIPNIIGKNICCVKWFIDAGKNKIKNHYSI